MTGTYRVYDPTMPRSLGYIAAFGVLAAITIGAALSLTSDNGRMGSRIAGDPETPAQWASSWRLGAVFAYTSGSFAGHICALVAGYLGARWSSQRDGVLAGLAIGVINVTGSVSTAVFATRDSTTMHGTVQFVDPNPVLQPAVLIAVAAVLGGAVIMGAIGSRVADLSRLRWLVMIAMAAVVPIFHPFATLSLLNAGLGLLR